MSHIYVEAYELKDGGFRAVACEYKRGAGGKDERVIEPIRGERRETFEEARNDAQRFAAQLLADRPFARGHYRNPRNNYRCNFWMADAFGRVA